MANKDNKTQKTEKEKKGGNPYKARTDYEQLDIEVCKELGKLLRKAIKSKDFNIYMQRHRRKFMKSVADAVLRFASKAKKDVQEALLKTYNDEKENEAKRAFEFSLNNMPFEKKMIDEEVKFGGSNLEKVNALNKELHSLIDDATRSILRITDDKYRQLTRDAVRMYAGGLIELDTAVSAATRTLKKNGIVKVKYKNGKEIQASSYIEMAARTANQRAKFYGEGALREETGNYLVIVSSHLSTCEKCAPWQGKTLIDDVFSGAVPPSVIAEYSGKYKTVSEAIKAGFMHPNCRHQLSTWYEGISRKMAETADEPTREKMYKAEVKQRALERNIRADKRALALAVTKKEKEEAEQSLESSKKELEKHLKNNTQLREIEWRENVYIKS